MTEWHALEPVYFTYRIPPSSSTAATTASLEPSMYFTEWVTPTPTTYTESSTETQTSTTSYTSSTSETQTSSSSLSSDTQTTSSSLTISETTSTMDFMRLIATKIVVPNYEEPMTTTVELIPVVLTKTATTSATLV